MSKWGELLSVIPTTRGNVVHLEPDPSRPPPAINHLYTDIMTRLQAVEQLRADISAMEQHAKEAAELARVTIAKANDRLKEKIADLEDHQSRWLMITRNLGIEIEE